MAGALEGERARCWRRLRRESRWRVGGAGEAGRCRSGRSARRRRAPAVPGVASVARPPARRRVLPAAVTPGAAPAVTYGVVLAVLPSAKVGNAGAQSGSPPVVSVGSPVASLPGVVPGSVGASVVVAAVVVPLTTPVVSPARRARGRGRGGPSSPAPAVVTPVSPASPHAAVTGTRMDAARARRATSTCHCGACRRRMSEQRGRSATLSFAGRRRPHCRPRPAPPRSPGVAAVSEHEVARPARQKPSRPSVMDGDWRRG